MKKEERYNSYSDKDRLLRMSEIGLWIDSYQDLFSDFDPRPYKNKALSFDFLEEAKRASRDKINGDLNLKFLIKKEMRNKKDEAVIIRRLKDHFKKHFALFKKERFDIIKKGLIFTAIGIVLMLIATYVLLLDTPKTFLTAFLIVLFEPGGWFLFWEGLHLVLFESKIKDPEYTFYEKMSKCRISFMNY